MSGSDEADWDTAMNEEIKAMKDNHTWKLTELPKGAKAISCKWIFKRKTNAVTGEVKDKARLVAQGFNQKYAIDYDEVLAPVVTATTLCLLLTIATQRCLKLYHFDEKTAFLNGSLKETVYMKQPEGYVNAEEGICLQAHKEHLWAETSGKNME